VQNAETNFKVKAAFAGQTFETSFTADGENWREYANAMMETYQSAANEVRIDTQIEVYRAENQVAVTQVSPETLSAEAKGKNSQISEATRAKTLAVVLNRLTSDLSELTDVRVSSDFPASVNASSATNAARDEVEGYYCKTTLTRPAECRFRTEVDHGDRIQVVDIQVHDNLCGRSCSSWRPWNQVALRTSFPGCVLPDGKGARSQFALQQSASAV
jgi:hypothetical protein